MGDQTGGTLYWGPVFWGSHGPLSAILVDGAGRVLEGFSGDVPDGLPGVQRRRLEGAWAMPGLVDAHVHLAWMGRMREVVELSGAASADEVARRVAAFEAAHPEVELVSGWGWDETGWPAAPSMNALERVQRPCVLTRADGHVAWLNAAAWARFEEAVRADGQAEAVRGSDRQWLGIIREPSPSLWARLAPSPTPVTLERWLLGALEAAAQAGFVAVDDMATRPEELQALERLAARPGGLPVRVRCFVDDSAASLAWLEAHPAGAEGGGGEVAVAGLKLFADGALGSRGAALWEAYQDAPETCGPQVDHERLVRLAVFAAKLGYPVAVHAIGDRAVSAALDAIAAAEAARPGLTHRVEHAQVVREADRARMAALRVTASVQPLHAVMDAGWAEARLGPERMKHAYAYSRLARAGVRLMLGSDGPIAPWRPEAVLAAAIRGADRDGGGLGVEEALIAYAGGRAGFQVGMRFEATLWDRDLTAVGADVRAARVVGRASVCENTH